MAQQFNGYAALPQHVQTVTISGQKYRLTFTARDRLQGWYLDMHTVDGSPIFLGRRLAAGWGPVLTLRPPGAPAGVLFVKGPNTYTLDDLGVALQLRHYTDAEIEAARPASSDGLLIEVTP